MGRRVVSRSNSGKATSMSMQSMIQQQLMMPQNDRVIYLSEDVNEMSISAVIAQIMALNSQNSVKPIVLMISTYGGSVDEMFALYDIVKFVKCPIITVGIGKVMSAGVLLLASGEKGKRMIGKNTRVMIHSISAGHTGGSIAELTNEVDELKKIQLMMINSLAKETNIPRDKLEEIVNANKDFYLTAEEAIKFGVADKILSGGKNE